ncbi:MULTISPECIES: peptide deformylase [unclassified Spiroplasma]|uniref:peptide deformylase n=1 Tax=unclassified Spiroplasma TaxID=2637901 RepID=UPI0027DF9AD5|nr:peptide deformylase [Spiroplasma sp. AdecLV25b]
MLKLLQNEKPDSSWITQDTTKTLLDTCTEVVLPLTNNDKDIMKKMIDWVKASQDDEFNANNVIIEAIGIAAPQIGKNVNMYYILLPISNKDGTITYYEHALINPKIIGRSEQIAALKKGEGCLSVTTKHHEGLVPRSYKIKVTGFDYLKNKKVNLTIRGYEAIVFQHEQDHLEGKLFYHHINKENPWHSNEEWIII